MYNFLKISLFVNIIILELTFSKLTNKLYNKKKKIKYKNTFFFGLNTIFLGGSCIG